MMSILLKSINFGTIAAVFVLGWLITKPDTPEHPTKSNCNGPSDEPKESTTPKWNGELDEPIWW
jgi:hypothetical protein